MDTEGTLLGEHMRLAVAWEKAHSDIAEALGPAFGKPGKRIQNLFAILRRLQLATTLSRWHIPKRFAHWVSRQWPLGWLPSLKPELWKGRP